MTTQLQFPLPSNAALSCCTLHEVQTLISALYLHPRLQGTVTAHATSKLSPSNANANALLFLYYYLFPGPCPPNTISMPKPSFSSQSPPTAQAEKRNAADLASLFLFARGPASAGLAHEPALPDPCSCTAACVSGPYLAIRLCVCLMRASRPSIASQPPGSCYLGGSVSLLNKRRGGL